MRQCPTLPGDARALITHQIEVGLCMERQRCNYHKCHRCAYRGQSATFTVDQPEFRNGVVDVVGALDGEPDLAHRPVGAGTHRNGI